MTKRIIALLLSLCLVLCAAPVYAGAATGQQVSADPVKAFPGETVAVTLRAENFENIAALDVYIYYDAQNFTANSTYDGGILSGAQYSVNTSQPGQIVLSAMSLAGMNGTGTLLTVYLDVHAACEPGSYPVTVAIGRAYDGSLQQAQIRGVSGSVTVEERVEAENFYIYSYGDKRTLKKGDVLTYELSSSWGYPFVSGDFTVTYDHRVFAFESLELARDLEGEGAIYSVNSSVLGQVRLTYASTETVNTYRLFTLKLKVIADQTGTTNISAQASNLYKPDLSRYLPVQSDMELTLTKLPETVDYPNAFFRTESLATDRQSASTFCLEAGAGVAAADFTITYDPAVLRCVGVTAAEGLEDKGGMVVINDDFAAGTIRFSYVNMRGFAQEDLPLLQILWEPICSPDTHYQVKSSAVGVVDASQTPITLEYVTDTGCIYQATITKQPTCQEEGQVGYACACGNTQKSQTLPVIPEAACTHYAVVFEDEDGTVLQEQTYHYGDAVTAPADPTKAADETYTYRFAGWDKPVTSVTESTVYTATYTSEYIVYTVVFEDEDGTVLQEQTYHYGDAVTAPADPTKAADETYTYRFAGWDKPVTSVTGNAVYTATYTSEYIVYTVVFEDEDGTILQENTYHYGDPVTAPADPTKAADETYTYRFAGWDKPVTSVTGNAVYTATYTSEYIVYTVVFEDEDGTVLQENTYHYGDPVTAPADPTKAADETYTYRFAGWNKPVTPVTGNAVYTATYTSEYIVYTVVFKDEDGRVLQEQTYHYGDAVTAPADPTKAADETYTYRFAGWDKPVTSVTESTVYTATYTSEYIVYTVVFEDEDGRVLQENTYHYGDPVTAPADPTKAADEIYTYSFVGWDRDVTKCYGNATYYATYTPVYINYTVTFCDEDGRVLQEQTYHYGDAVELPENPVKNADETFIYPFVGWDREVTECRGNATYYAVYAPVYINYTVTFCDEDGTILQEQTYHYGDTVTAPADPTKAEDETHVYTFSGWDKEVAACTGDAVYTATYTAMLLPDVAVLQTENGDVAFKRLYRAILAADENGMIRLIGDVTEDITVDKHILLDLCGFDLAGDVTVIANAQLLIKDSQTDDYTVEDAAGYGKIVGTVVGAQPQDGYLLLTETEGVSFHRVHLEVTAMTLRASQAGVYFKCRFMADEAVARNVEAYGIALRTTGAPTAENPGVCSRYETFAPKNGTLANSTLLKDIMKPGNSDQVNEENAQMQVYGRPYILTKNGTYYFGACVNRSLREQVELADILWFELTAVQQTTLLEMLDAYRRVMSGWEIPNILEADRQLQ